MKKEDKKLYFCLIALIVCIGAASVIIAVSTREKQTLRYGMDSTAAHNESTGLKSPDIFPADINTITLSDLTLIDGIGEHTAENIIKYRIENTRYNSIDDLLKVDGIGDKTYKKLCRYLYVDGEITQDKVPLADDDKPVVSKPVTTAVKTQKSVKYPLEINLASKKELMTLSNIGNERAQAIIAYRQRTPFYSAEDIMKVNGIGEQIYNSIKDRIYVDTERLPVVTTAVTTEAPVHTTVSSDTESVMVNINTATREEFMTLNGMTEAIVDKILLHRDFYGNKFNNKEELTYFMTFSVYNKIRYNITT